MQSSSPMDAPMTTDSLGSRSTPVPATNGARSVADNLARGTNNLMRASDLDLRKTKNELFSKLIERKPQQMIVTTAAPNRTTSDENLNASSSLQASFKGLNKGIELTSYGSSATNRSLGDSKTNPYQLLTSNSLQLDSSCITISSPNSQHQQRASSSNCQRDTSRQHFAGLFATRLEPAMFSRIRSKWYTNEEVASILTSYIDHPEWQSNELQMRPKSGAVLLYSREKVRYRQDGYCWKKRKNGRTTREDHMKLKVQGIECIYGCYVHSALLPTFHRRCYWLLENPDIVLVHYLNQPADDKNKMILTFNSNLLELDTKRRWTNEEIIEEIGSVFGGISQIHRTLSINFPAINQTAPEKPIEQPAQGDRHQQATKSDNNNNQNKDSRMLAADEQVEAGPQQETSGDDQEDELDNGEDEEMIVTSLDDNSSSQSRDDLKDCNRRRRRHSALAITSSEMGAGTGESAQMMGHEFDGQATKQQSATNDAMTFDIVIEQRRLDNDSIKIEPNAGDIQQPATMYGLDSNQLFRQQPTQHQVADSDSKSFCDDLHQEAPASSDINNPCSPVTQIYNKIVDDIETYAIPFELNQFEPNHHHPHLHHHDQNHQQQPHLGNSEIQSMDTSEPADQRDLDGDTPKRFLSVNRGRNRHSYSSEPQQNSTASSGQLVSCDLFASCGHLADDNKNNTGTENATQDNDMLLAQFELTEPDNRDGCAEGELDNCNGETAGQVESMRDLLMGLGSNQSALTDETDQSTNQLLLACQDPIDPLESLFAFKPLNCDSMKADHHNQLLDVKSTTSETADSLLNRLSPIVTARQPPRCNSSDDAMQLSAQRLDQYLHHASINFLATNNNNNTSQDEQDDQLLVSNFSDFDHHHSLNTGGSSGPDGLLAHHSGASTEQSNSTSTSSLLNVATGGNGAGYLGINSADRGPISSSGSNYNESSATTSSSPYIKLPLQQRQNSEQREPSNSVLNSLLPKAFSLDGSDLSSTASSHSHHTANLANTHQHSQHQNHHHHLQYHGSHHHHHHHHHHHQRTSPLIGPYHTGGGHHSARPSLGLTNAGARSSGLGGQQQHMLLVPSVSNSCGHNQALLTSRHHYQRPSAPSISPSSGTYSLDSSLAVAGKQPLGESEGVAQYRSGSVVATTTTLCFNQQQQSSTNEQGALGSRARLLPILDYVPNWSPSSGGIKILLIGNWTSLTAGGEQANETGGKQQQTKDRGDQQPEPAAFYVLFDELLVPASLIQDNVLRCFSPQHEPGFIALEVLFKNVIVSEQVLFEVRPDDCADSTATTTTTTTMASNALTTPNHNQHNSHQAAA